MNEVFVDGPENFTSDGSNIKFTLVSVQKDQGGLFRPADVVQVVCSLQAASRIAAFLHSVTQETQSSSAVAPEVQDTPSVSEGVVEERRLLSKRGVPHHT
jgi:hypothetical protein